MDLFVKNDSTVEVEVFVFEQDGQVLAVADQSELPKEEKLEVKTIKFVFRKPCYQDSVNILTRSQVKNSLPTEENPVRIDANNFNSAILFVLLKDWDITNEKGEKIAVSVKSINTLQPTIARAAVAGCLQKVSI